jgi:hypothetical protein
MSAAAAQRLGIELPAIQRFELADLSTHGPWLLPRLVAALQLPEQRIGGWLRSVIDSKDFMFLVQPHSAALAEMQPVNGLANKPIIRERFVLVEDVNNTAHVAEAAEFYPEFKRWAQNLGAEVIMVVEMTNVPQPLIEKKLGNILTRQELFVRV